MAEFVYASLRTVSASRRLLHGGGDDDAAASAPADSLAASAAEPSTSSSDTLKWIFAAVIFAESLLGLALPLLLSWRGSWFAQPAFLSLLNCFAGGVFLGFGKHRFASLLQRGLICCLQDLTGDTRLHSASVRAQVMPLVLTRATHCMNPSKPYRQNKGCCTHYVHILAKLSGQSGSEMWLSVQALCTCCQTLQKMQKPWA